MAEVTPTTVNRLLTLNNTKVPDAKTEKTEQPLPQGNALKQNETLDISSNSQKGHTILELNLTEKPSNVLPPVEVQVDGRLTHSTNAYGRTITALKQDSSINYSTLSESGLSIILKNNFDKRDVIVFSNMSNKISKNSLIPNDFFHVEGTEPSKMYFDDNHNIVIDLKNKEKIVIDGKDGQTVLQGPFKLNFDENKVGDDFKVKYQGKSKLNEFRSFGDKIKW